jgi:hypothetical protein
MLSAPQPGDLRANLPRQLSHKHKIMKFVLKKLTYEGVWGGGGIEISFHVFSDITVRNFRGHSPTAFSGRKTHGSEKWIVPIIVQNVEPPHPTYSGNKRRLNCRVLLLYQKKKKLRGL